jgi:DNA polymerase
MDKADKIAKISSEVASCQKCPLYKNATNPVSGEGNPEAEIMFIGEGPGYWEDQKGIPFCGQAGKLLDELLQSIKVARKDVYITNVVKHRPPGNRDPQPEEIEACKNFLDRQIEIIQPKIIVTLGRFSMAKFIPEGKISQIHGQARFVEFAGRKIIVIPMFHPAAALRGEQVMRMLKEDFLKIPLFLKNNEKILETEQVKPQDNQLQLI